VAKTPSKIGSVRKPGAPKTAAAREVSKASASRTAAKAPAKAVKKPVKTATEKATILTLRHLAERLSEAHELPKRQANEMLTQVVEMITRSLKKGEKIRLSGLGILQVRKRAARTGRNPQTGEPIKIKASKKIAFRPAKELKDAI
jgi:DNA-binding protein HU-beta